MNVPDSSTLNQRISDASLYEMQEKALRRARVLHRASQLRNYDRIAHRLTATGRDIEGLYHKLDTDRRDALEATEPNAESMPVVHPVTHSGLYDLTTPFLGSQGELVMGSQGFVRIPPASNGISVTPGAASTSGEFEMLELGQRGGILFSGYLQAEGPGDPEDLQVWLRNWRYVVPFPCTPSRAHLTYTFKVTTTFRIGGADVADGTIMSFVSVGEQPAFGAGVEIDVNEDAGWPVVADLTQPVVSESGAIDYNGFFGVLSGETIVQGKFSVLAGNTPAIGVVVGAIALISSGSCLFRFHGGSRIIPSSADGLPGIAQYQYQPILVVTAGAPS